MKKGIDGFTLFASKCDCVNRAISRKYLRDSGLESIADKYVFDNFLAGEEWQSVIKSKAYNYISEWHDNSFFICGASGCGKTHICTACCGELINQGISVQYFRWIADGARIKSVINERELYQSEIEKLLRCDMLYLDDLFKGAVSSADIRLAFQLIDGRYVAGKPLIASSELSLEEIKAIDEAIAGRLFEMSGSGKYIIDIKGGEKNHRFNNIPLDNTDNKPH